MSHFRLNGTDTPLTTDALLQLLTAHGIDPSRKGMAVALNRTVLPRTRWPETRIRPGDEIEIVQPLSGG